MPLEALVLEKQNAFAYTIKGDRASKRPIKIGFKDAQRVEVLEGLESEEPIILVGKLKLSDGQPVQATAQP